MVVAVLAATKRQSFKTLHKCFNLTCLDIAVIFCDSIR